MESRSWILQLPAGADTIHGSIFPSPQAVQGVAKRPLDESGTLPRENGLERKSPRIKRATGVEGILKGRPILSDLVNDIR
jgi:hypothetical protein